MTVVMALPWVVVVVVTVLVAAVVGSTSVLVVLSAPSSVCWPARRHTNIM